MPGREEYRFESRWLLHASAERAWALIEGIVTGSDGALPWPGVRVEPAAVTVRSGERLGIRVRSPLGYTLRVDAVLGRVDPGRELQARAHGDLDGVGTVSLVPGTLTSRRTGETRDGCLVVIRWYVRTTRPWMNAAAPLLRPAFVVAHALVMRAGERGARRALRGKR